MEERQTPGLALAISRNGEIVVARGYGVADVQNGAPVTAVVEYLNERGLIARVLSQDGRL